jgi:hypothetical protein
MMRAIKTSAAYRIVESRELTHAFKRLFGAGLLMTIAVGAALLLALL